MKSLELRGQDGHWFPGTHWDPQAVVSDGNKYNLASFGNALKDLPNLQELRIVLGPPLYASNDKNLRRIWDLMSRIPTMIHLWEKSERYGIEKLQRGFEGFVGKLEKEKCIWAGMAPVVVVKRRSKVIH